MTPESINPYRSLQQLVASAIKHSASEVSFPISTAAKTQLRFRLSDNRSSELEVAVPPLALTRVILERARLFPALTPTKIRSGLLRTEFSSLVSDCEVMFTCHGPGDVLSKVVLSNFNVDAPDKAGFWLGFEDTVAEKLRRLLGQQRGLLLIWDEDTAGRNDALSALRSAYPEAESIPLVDALAEDLSFVKRSREKLVFAGVGGRDPFAVLRSLLMFRPANRESILGVVFQSELPRNCISCRKEGGEIRDEKLRAQFGRQLRSWQVDGCPVCDERRTVGRFSVVSLIPFLGEARELFWGDAPWLDLLEQVRLEGFYHPFEYGLRAISAGEVSEENLLKGIARPAEPYKLHIPPVPATEEQQSVSETGRFVLSPEFFTTDGPGERPVQGPEVFFKHTPSSAPGRTEEKKENSDSKKVLVIDDDPDQRAILGKVFQLAGYAVSSAADGIDGIVSATREHPEVIVVDLMMPNMDGRETIRRLRENPETKSVPIVALTAYPDPEVEYDLLDAGADDFCPKSVSKKVLLKRIERLIGR